MLFFVAVVLATYSCAQDLPCVQRSFLEALWGLYVVPRIKLNWVGYVKDLTRCTISLAKNSLAQLSSFNQCTVGVSVELNHSHTAFLVSPKTTELWLLAVTQNNVTLGQPLGQSAHWVSEGLLVSSR